MRDFIHIADVQFFYSMPGILQSKNPLASDSEAQRISRIIFKYAERIGRERETDALLALNASMARDLVAADRCSIWLVDRMTGELWTKVAHGIDEIRIPFSQGLVGSCIERNEPIVVNDTAADPRFLQRIDRDSGYITQNMLVIPLRATSGDVIGALQALNKPGGFTASDIGLLGLASSYSGSAIDGQRLQKEAESARLIYRELEIARDVQARLLPAAAPKIAGLDCAAYCRPAKFVGGDYYDFLSIPHGGLAFTLGDVSGKGVAAAVLMASIQSSLRAHMVGTPPSLGAMMSAFNETLYSMSTSDKYSTLFCGIIDESCRLLRYVNAGQTPPLVLRKTDGPSPMIERLSVGGVPVGLLRSASFEDAEIRLQPGDVFVSFSDGISETTNAAGEMWDDEEPERLLAAYGHLPAAALIEQFVQAADAFTGDADQADDMTIIVIRVE